MESSCSSSQVSSSPLDYTFAFNNPMFSDRTLHLHVMSQTDPIDILPERIPKRRCTDQDSNGHQVLQSNENQSSACGMVKTVQISTVVLAAKSPFFYKLFSNGMSESNEHHVTLQIQQSEEAAFMDLLKFMYTNTLSSTTPSALLDVLIVADKYEVASCMKYCFHLLSKLPITRESALLYLDLPKTNLMADTVKPLIDAAKNFLVARFKKISEFEEEMLTLPLVGIEAVLLSDDLQVNSEDCIYDFVLKWARKHYTTLDERQEILTTSLLHLIRFPFMSCRKLEEVLTCKDINLRIGSKLVFHALSSKIPHQQLPCALVERAYKCRPVKVTRFDSPREMCKVYLNLKHDECARLLPDDEIRSQEFDLAGRKFWLMGSHDINERSQVHRFGIYLCTHEIGPFTVEYEFSCRKKPFKKFVNKKKITYDFADTYACGCNLFGVHWDEFIAENSPYFINGVLHLRARIKINKEV